MSTFLAYVLYGYALFVGPAIYLIWRLSAGFKGQAVRGSLAWHRACMVNRIVRWPAVLWNVEIAVIDTLGFLFFDHSLFHAVFAVLWGAAAVLNVRRALKERKDDDWFDGWKKRFKVKVRRAVAKAHTKVAVAPVPVPA